MTPPVLMSRPTARPPVALRVLLGLTGLAAALASVAVLLSDRAPDALRALFGDAVVRISDRLDAGRRADAALGDNVPGDDAIVHIAIWAGVAGLFGLAMWTWWGLFATAAFGLVGATAVELAQGRYSTTRAVERSDLLANAVGIAAGCAVCAICFVAWSGGAAMVRRVGGG